MSNFDNMYHDFFGMKNQTNEADLLNKLTDYISAKHRFESTSFHR